MLAGLGRPHQLGDQLLARGIAWFARPIGDGVAIGPEDGEQFAEAELGMRRFELHPAFLVDLAIEAGQHHRTLRQARDNGQKFACRGLRARRAGSDYRRHRRVLPPARSLGSDRFGAARDRIDLPTLRQHLWPRFAHDGEELQRPLPMAGEIALHQCLQPVEGHTVDGKFVEQAAEFPRKR
jgi:hypothetical protein